MDLTPVLLFNTLTHFLQLGGKCLDQIAHLKSGVQTFASRLVYAQTALALRKIATKPLTMT